MKKESNNGRSRIRVVFCLVLVLALLAGVFSLNGVAANSEPVQYDIKVASCQTHTATVSDGDLYVWGTNDYGQFISSLESYSAQPIKIGGGVKDVAVTPGRTLVLYKTGKLYEYGKNPYTGEISPTQGVLLGSDVIQISACGDLAAFVTKDGAVFTCGSNASGQIGDGSTADGYDHPVKVITSGVTKAVAGRDFVLALKEDGTLFGWGNNLDFQLGLTEAGESVSTPTQILDNVADVEAGYYHSMILKNDKSLWTCGSNSFNQLGIASSYSRSSLTKVLDNVRWMSAGSTHSFAIDTDGVVACWGYGLSGQLGTGTTGRLTEPTPTEFDFVQIYTGNDTTFGISPDGSIWSWGDNTNYVLCKDNGSNSYAPVRVLDYGMNWVYDSNNEPSDDPTDKPTTTPNPNTPDVVSTPFVSGYEDGTFLPKQDVTRAEFLRMLISGLCDDYGPAVDYGKPTFSDVKENDWFYNYIAYAQKNKIASGYEDGTFLPNAKITREEAAVLVASVMGVSSEDAPNYTDVAADRWSVWAISALSERNILSGYEDGSFQPKQNITRAEAARVISSAIGFNPTLEEVPSILEGKTTPFTDIDLNAWYGVYILRALGYVE